jgi:acyl-CoA synthetase (AMP-forming)/AMP-acid ligase II
MRPASPPPIPQVTLEQFEGEYRDLHTIPAAIDRWASLRPEAPAVIDATRGTQITWRELARGSAELAGELERMGFRKGDFLATSLGLAEELILLELACFRLGVIHAPLDLRSQPGEVLRALSAIGARGYGFPERLAETAEAARARCAGLEHLIEVSPSGFAAIQERAAGGMPVEGCRAAEHECAQVIFTTGSTGSPKPALLSHRGITCQNLCLGTAFGFGPGKRVLCNLPPSHVGGQAEVLLTSLFTGATAVTLETFDPVRSLDAIERWGVTLIGQIPAMFQMEWRTAAFAARTFPSLEIAVYGGQAVPRAFLDRMLGMAPRIATGLGLTECSGFCTYTQMTGDPDALAGGIGWAMPAYPMSIREPMSADGAAGRETADGETGHVCFRGPQTFLGYLNDPAATAATLSTDGWLYTGDMGRLSPGGLHFAGRAGWVIKRAGYQVFPGDIEEHLSALEAVASAGVVGHEHGVWSEAAIAFVERREGAELAERDLRRHARSLASYMRPLHYVILEPGAMPLNRAAKVDVPRLREMAREEVGRLRARGRWDGEAAEA